MSAICAQLGGSKGTMWSYFPSKEDLFAAVLEEATRAYREQLEDLLQPSEDLPGTIRRFCTSFLARITSADALRLHRLVVAEAERFPEIGEIAYRRVPQASRDRLARFLEQQMGAGKLRRDDPLHAAEVLTGLCMAGLHQRMLWGQPEGSVEERDREALAAADVFLRAYAVDSQ